MWFDFITLRTKENKFSQEEVYESREPPTLSFLSLQFRQPNLDLR